jgi:putative transposase
LAGGRRLHGQGPFRRRKKGSNPTDRAKADTKKSLIVERSGGPLGLEIDGANVHETKLLEATIEAILVERPDPAEWRDPARRWMVERRLAWLQKCQAILVRYDKKGNNYRGLIQLACALLWYRRLYRLREAQAF